MQAAGGSLISTRIRGLPEGLPSTLAGAGIGVIAGLALAQAGALPSTFLIGAIAIAALTPLVVALDRLALPVWVAVFGVLYPFARFPADGPIITFDRLYLAALLVALVLGYRRRSHARETIWLQRGLLALTAVFLASALTGGERTTASLAIWLDAFLLPLIVFWAAREAVRERAQMTTIAGAMAFAGATIAALGLAQRFAGLDLTPLLGTVDRFDAAIGEVRISGPFAAPEPFALVLLVCLGGSLLWVRARGPAALVPGGIAIGLLLAAIFFTYFRAAWLGAALVLLVAFVADQRSATRRAGAVAVAVGGLVLVSVLASGSEDVQTRLRDERNVSGRVATYERGLELFRRHPAFGVGFQRYEAAVREVPQASVEGVRAIPQAHSSIVSTLAEQGLLGFLPLAAVAAALAAVLRALWRRSRERVDRALAIYATGVALAFLVLSATLTMIYYGPSNAMMALLAGLACGRLDALSAR